MALQFVDRTVLYLVQVNLDMTDSMGPSISSVICRNPSYSGPSYPSSPVATYLSLEQDACFHYYTVRRRLTNKLYCSKTILYFPIRASVCHSSRIDDVISHSLLEVLAIKNGLWIIKVGRDYMKIADWTQTMNKTDLYLNITYSMCLAYLRILATQISTDIFTCYSICYSIYKGVQVSYFSK